MTNHKPTMVLGASENKDRYSNKAVRLLKSYNHPVIAVGLKEGKIDDTDIQTHWAPKDSIHTLSVYLNPSNQPNLLDQIVELNPKRVIFNPGAENPPMEEKLTEMNIEVLNACTLVMLRTGMF
nr:CoA-binding protein [Saprospiraceae bacterium]